MIKINKEFISGMVVGFGSGVAFRSISGKETVSWKGIVKSTMRSSLSAYEKIKDSVARTKENLEDLAAEVKSEMQVRKEEKSDVPVEPGLTSVTPSVEAGLSVASE